MKNIIYFLVIIFSHGIYAQKKPLNKPNIIIILTDDQGWADVGFNGCTDIPTPNLDKMASEGVIFSNGYVSHPYCSPSRAGLLTGRYQARFGHDCNLPYKDTNDETIGTPLSEKLISEALKEQGYRTSAIGKWHIGDDEALHPTQQGFDEWYGFPGGSMDFWGTPNGKHQTIFRNGAKVPLNEITYLTDDFTNEAINFINKKDDKPFFIYLAYNSPHAPNQSPEKYLEKTNHIEYAGRSIYGAMVNGVDAGVGKIDSTLVSNGIKDNTIVVFLSDNGGRGTFADNKPNRGYKGMLYEGGIKVPYFINWPEKINNNQVYDNIVSSLDIYPTLLDASGARVSKEKQLEGTNLLPYILNKKKGEPHNLLYWRSVGGFEYAVRKGDYKLYKSDSPNRKIQLFNLKDDAYERKDISKNHPEIVAKLQEHYKKWDAKNMVPGWIDPHEENVYKEENRLYSARKKAANNTKEAFLKKQIIE